MCCSGNTWWLKIIKISILQLPFFQSRFQKKNDLCNPGMMIKWHILMSKKQNYGNAQGGRFIDYRVNKINQTN